MLYPFAPSGPDRLVAITIDATVARCQARRSPAPGWPRMGFLSDVQKDLGVELVVRGRDASQSERLGAPGSQHERRRAGPSEAVPSHRQQGRRTQPAAHPGHFELALFLPVIDVNLFRPMVIPMETRCRPVDFPPDHTKEHGGWQARHRHVNHRPRWRRERAMADPQPRRPMSPSPTDASRPESSASNPDDRPRRVRVYERLGRSTGLSSAIIWSIVVVILAIIIALIIIFVR
jgi:hypothetical protein